MNATTTTTTPTRREADTRALLQMLSQGGTLAGLHGLSAADLEPLYAAGLAQYAQARYAEAAKLFGRLVMLRHGDTRYLNALAACHQMLGQHERAVHYWGVSQLLDLKDPAPTFHTAHSLLALGLTDDALDALDSVLAQCDGQPQHQVLQARAQALQALVRSRSAAPAAA